MTTTLGQIADAYDAWIKQSYGDLDEMYYYYNNEVARKFGPNSRQARSFLVATTTLYGLYTASQIVGQGFVDKLRVGESLDDFTVGNVLQDGLRLVSLAAPAFKVVRVASALGIARGNYAMSCGATGTTFAARLSGTKIAMRLGDFRRILNLQKSPTDPAFTGTQWDELKKVMSTIGAKFIFRSITGWDDLKRMVNLQKGPVIFDVAGVDAKGPFTHVMTAFSVAGKLLFADQFGIRAEATFLSRFAATRSKFIAGMIVEDSALVPAVDYASGLATEANIVASGLGRVDDVMNWIDENLLIPVWIIPGKVLWGLGDLVNEKLGRPSRSKDEDLSGDATRVLRVTPGGAGKSGSMVQVGSGLSSDAFVAAVAELEAKGYVRVTRAANAPLGIAAITRIKG